MTAHIAVHVRRLHANVHTRKEEGLNGNILASSNPGACMFLLLLFLERLACDDGQGYSLVHSVYRLFFAKKEFTTPRAELLGCTLGWLFTCNRLNLYPSCERLGVRTES